MESSKPTWRKPATVLLLLALAGGCQPPPDGESLGLGHAPRSAAECEVKRGDVVIGDACSEWHEIIDGRFVAPAGNAICCVSIGVLPTVEPGDCGDLFGGEVFANPGPILEECPDGRELLGWVSFGLEGGFCCGPLPD